MNGVTCNGKTVSASILCPGSEGSDCTDTASESVCSIPEQSQDPNDFSNRYPLFIQVNSSQVANKARIVKPVGRATNQGCNKQDDTQDKQTVRPRRSASFSAPRKTATPSRPSQSSQPAQNTLRNGNLRREKSDIVRPRRTQSPANSTAIPIPARSKSSSSLKQDNIVVSPRSQSPAGIRREHSDVTKRRVSPSVRREKSDIVRPRGQLRTNSPTVSNEGTEGDISRSSSNRSLTSSPLSKSPSKSSIEGSRSRSGSSSEMSKIPSLVRSPASAEKADSHVSRIPSLTKKNNTEERTPPRSKIPSSTKVEKGQDVAKKSQIPTVGRKDSASQRDKAASRIPSSTALTQNRPDAAKENKDPTAASVPNGHETVKQVSKIPSFSKSGIPKSKIPSVTRKDSQNEEPPTQNGEGETHSPVNRTQSDTSKSKIPSASSTPQGTGIPVGASRIPSFTKSPSTPKTPESKLPTLAGSKSTEPDGPPANVSHIPTFPSTPPNKTPESKVPVPGGSRIPEPKTAAKSPPSSLPVSSKPSGIPKPGELTQASRIPGYAGENSTRKMSSTEKETVATGIPVASSPVETKSKIPSLPRQTAIPKPNGSEHASSKPRTGIPTLGGKRPSVDQETPSPDEPATPPSTPIRDTFASESPLDKYIFSEAKKMEQILRDEPIEVTVPAKEFEDDEEFLRQEKEIAEQEQKEHEKELRMLDSKEAEDLISEVLKSYAPDINKENQPELEDVNLYTVKDDNRNIKEKVNIDDIVLKPANSENELPSKLDVKDVKAEHAIDDFKVDSKEVKANGVEEVKIIGKVEEEKPSKVAESKKNVPDLKIAIPIKKVIENEPEEKGEKEATKNEGPAIDTLGEYAQQARRSRSRQRKIVSPDSEEPEKEFVAEPEKELEKQVPKASDNTASKEQSKKDIKKDKYGTAPFDSEKKPKEASKTAKSKSKSDKPKFVIESSLGKDFYATRKSNESMDSHDSVHDDVVKSSFKPELSALVFENKIVEKPFTLKQSETTSAEEAVSLEEAEFEDVDLRSEQGMKKELREISRSVDTLDEKTVKCMGCGRGGKCSIM